MKTATKVKKYNVVKTITRVLPAEYSKSGKQEILQDNLYYYHGTWKAEGWTKQEMSLKDAKRIVIELDNNNPQETFNWILVK